MSVLRLSLAFLVLLFTLPCAAQATPLGPRMDDEQSAELEAVEKRLDEILRERPRLGGPIALTTTGVVLAAVPLAFSLLVLIQPPHRSFTPIFALGLAAAALPGAAVAAGGAVWLKRRLRERRQYKPELDTLQLRRRQLLQEVHYGFNGRGLSLTATF